MTELLEVAPREITTNPKNPRRAVGDLDDLAASIREHGVLEPLVVAPQVNGGKGTYQLIMGHRRLAAAKIAKLKTIPVILRPDLDTPARQLETALVENLHRSDLSPVEEAEGYQLLLTFPGYTQAKVAKATGRSTRTVRDRLALTKLPVKTRDRIHNGQISLTEAAALAEFVDDPKALATLEKSAGTTNFGWNVETLRRRRKDVKDAARARADLEAAGVKIVPDPGWSNDGGPKRLGSYQAPKMDPEDHAKTCQHHAAAEPTSGHVYYVCLDPLSHPASDLTGAGAPLTAAEKAAAKKERAALEELSTAVETAAALRLAFIQSVTDGSRKVKDTEQLIERHMLRQIVESYVEIETADVARYLRLTAPEPTPDNDDDDALADLVATQIERRSPSHLFLAVAAAHHEPNLSSRIAWTGPLDETDVAWLHLLVDLGYEISDFERAAVDAALGAASTAAGDEAGS